MLRRWEAGATFGKYVIEFRDDFSQHSEPPQFLLGRERQLYSAHEQQTYNPSRRRPSLDTPFGFIIEQLLATTGSFEILPEKGGSFVIIKIPELVSAQWARNAPAL
jgi:hypothetical protein